jgi:hypothetical protein
LQGKKIEKLAGKGNIYIVTFLDFYNIYTRDDSTIDKVKMYVTVLKEGKKYKIFLVENTSH